MQELAENSFREIARLMHEQVGLSFPAAKRALVSSRLAPRIQRLGLDSFDDYLALIGADVQGTEFQRAIDLLTTNETYFFREREHFERLEREFTGLSRRPIAVWSAAASYGDEAYSIAMLLADLEGAGRVSSNWSVLGTDISDRVLRSASEAIYPADRLRHVSPERLRRHCLRGEGDCEGFVQMQDHLRARVRFGRLNLSEPIDLDAVFDAVFLRNVLIYFDAPTKRAVVDRVLQRLRPGGLFFVGMAEGRVSSSVTLEALGPGAFRKVA